MRVHSVESVIGGFGIVAGEIDGWDGGGTAPKEDAAKERRGPLADVAGASKDEVKELNGAREEDDLERLCLSIISVERSDGKTMDSPPNIILPAGSFDQSQPRKQTLPVICCIYPTSPTLSVLNHTLPPAQTPRHRRG